MTIPAYQSRGISKDMAYNEFLEAHENGLKEIRKILEHKSAQVFKKNMEYNNFLEFLNFKEIPVKYGFTEEEMPHVNNIMKSFASLYFGTLINDKQRSVKY